MSAHASRALAHRTYQALNEALRGKDMSLIDDFIDADFVDHEMTTGADRDRETLKRSLSQLLAAVPDLEIVVDDIIADGTRAAGRITLRGTRIDEWSGSPPTRSQRRWTRIDIWRFSGGMAVERWGQGIEQGLRLHRSRSEEPLTEATGGIPKRVGASQ